MEDKTIPDFNISGVLPPFRPGKLPTESSAAAPYKVKLMDFIQHFCTNDDRRRILEGYINYRIALKKCGIKIGFQWIDGSFVENVEKTQKRTPNDLDLITFAFRPADYLDEQKWKTFIYENKTLFTPNKAKKIFYCDAYYVDFNLGPKFIVQRTTYFFGLFSHQRETFLWKGLLEIDLGENDDEAKQFLANGGNYAT